ncbi:hypothetical protein HanPSC8_Chr16g0698271 [Helianthus annuus]|nr:hypothetical protein HanPSC8_Chr16g0698271 [Helianthus annuus]
MVIMLYTIRWSEWRRCFRDIGDGYAQASYLGFDERKGKTTTCQQGISVSSAFIDADQFWVAFGGYNGKYNNEVFF